MKKGFGLLLIGLLVFSLLLGLAGCAQPAPTPTQAPKPAPTLAATPKPTAPTTPPETKIEVWTSKFGGSGYIAGNASAEIINKQSKWLRAVGVETLGTPDALKRYDALTPEQRKKVIMIIPDLNYWQAIQGLPPLTKKYDFRAISLMGAQAFFFASMNDKIKTYPDLTGKKVNVGAAGSSTYDLSKFLLQHAFGIWDKADKQTLGFGDAKNALLDGRLDAYLALANVVAEGQFGTHETLVEPMASPRAMYFLSATKDDLARAAKSSGQYFAYTEIPAGALGPKQTAKITSASLRMFYAASPEVPNEVVYEWMRIADEYSKDLVPYGAFLKLLTPANLGWLPVASEAEVHPGALKYYKDKKLSLRLGL